MRALLLHARSTPLRWLLLPLVVLDLAVILTRDPYWHGLWGDTGAAGQLPVVFLGIFAAGAAAWAAGLRRPASTAELLSAMPRPAHRAELPRMAVVLGIVLLPYLIGQAVCFFVTARTWPAGLHLYLGYLLLGAAALLLACGWGWVIGRLMPNRWGPLAGAFGWLLVVLAVESELSVVSGPARLEPDLPLLALRAVTAVLLLAVCLWLPFGPPARRKAALPWAAVAGAVVLSVVVAGLPVIGERHGSPSALCVTGRTTICLWPEEEKYLALAEEVLERVDALPEGVDMPATVHSFGLVDQGREGWAGDFTVHGGSVWPLADGVARAVTREIFEGCDWDAYFRADDPSLLALERWLEKRLAGGGDPLYTESGLSEQQSEAIRQGMAMTDRPETEQVRWAQDTVSRVKETYCG
ncbi:hypothetical protein GCM10009716_12360 [Streptomyces sodiiphilus]|uniref:ABC transporter permease n=1 Tax=Streptomyces sodiiphilus TaxID=226217 RepID=A0ABP5A7I9_9ACTN